MTVQVAADAFGERPGVKRSRSIVSRSWVEFTKLALVAAVAYFLAARTSVALLRPEGVTMLWPALGLAVGCLIALGSNARAPVATGICLGIVAARSWAGANVWLAVALGLCNTGGALLTTRLIERYFGPAFNFENLSSVLGFLGATAVGTLAAAVSGTAVIAINEPTTDILSAWRGWFTSAALGIVTVAPLPIGIASAIRRPLPRRERVEGVTALVTLGATGAFVISLPPGPWATAMLAALVFPLVLWIAVRCRPVFAAAAAFIVALVVVCSTAHGLSRFADASVPVPDRTLVAQTIVLAGALCLLILSALFAERREYEMILEDSNRRLQLVLVEQQEAQRTLFDRNAQLDLAGRVARIGSFTYDQATRKSQFSPGCAAIYGLPEGTREISLRHWRALVHPDDLPRLDAIARGAIANRDSELVQEFRILRHGEVRWIESRILISYDEVGKPVRRIGANIDVTERKQAELALAERNTQLALAGKAGLVATFAYDVNTGRVQISEGYAAIYGFPEGTTEIERRQWHALVLPDDLERLESVRRQAFAGRLREYGLEYRIVPPDRGVRWIETRSFVLYDGEGRPQRVVGVNIDITERKRTEEARKILNAELDHRVKNALSTVSAVVSHTRQGRRSFADFVAALDGRIRSMATTHEMLSAHRWHGVSLMEIVRREVAPYSNRNNTEIDGTGVLLKPEAAQAMAMVLHELATNAAKYGAFSTKKGRVSVRWDRQLNADPRSNLVLEWREVDGPRVDAPGKSSYGTSTIRDLIPYEFGGMVDLVFAPEGVMCRLELPTDWLANTGKPTEALSLARHIHIHPRE